MRRHFVVALIVVFSAIANGFAGDFFLAPQYTLQGISASGIASGDFNHDGNMDLVLADYGSGTLTVLLGNGNAQFTTGNSYQFRTGSYIPGQLLVADFGNDGNLDVVVADPSSNFPAPLTLFEGNGDGTFKNPVTIPGHQGWVSFFAADINGDGFLDLVARYADCSVFPPFTCNGGLSVLLGKADGTFSAPLDIPDLSPSSITVADFNHDGKLDLAMIVGGSLEVALGNGDGTFQAPTTLLSNGIPYLSFVAAADVNGDGKSDLIATLFDPINDHNKIAVLLGNGDGTFKQPQDNDSPPGVVRFSVADLNGDGKPDLITESDTIGVLLGRGDGSFQPPILYSPGGAVAPGDFNNDGKLDVAALGGKWSSNNFVSVLSVLLNDGTGELLTARSYDAGTPVSSMASADFNGDGNPDFALSDSNGNVRLLLGAPNGVFQSPAIDTGLAGLGTLLSGDFNNDGKADLAGFMPSAGDAITTYLGNGDGTFQGSIQSPTLPQPLSLAAGDLNGDGNLDLAITSGPGCDCNEQISTLLGDGTGRFSMISQYSLPFGHPFPVLADMNQDGILDAVVGNEYGGFYSGFDILLGNGNGSLQSPKHYIFPPSNTAPNSMVVADLNADGKPDVVGGLGNGIVEVFINKGKNQFAPPVFYYLNSFAPGGPLPYLVAGDFNGDGKIDIAVGGVSILYGNGDGTFQPAVDLIPHPQDESVLLTGDFNSDGAPDLAIARSRTSTITVLLNVHGASAVLSSSPSVAAPNQPVTLIATIGPSIKTAGVPAGAVIFKEGNVDLGFGRLLGNKAQFTTSFSTLGTHLISGIYSGDSYFFRRNIPAVAVQIIAVLPTTTTVSSSASSTVTGQNVTFTAHVASPYSNQMTGTVQFNDFGSPIGSASLSGSSAVFMTSALPAGPHLITAAYSGDAFYAPSLSPSLPQVVKNPSQVDTVVTVQPNFNPVLFRRKLVLTCTVSANTGTPDGHVKFMDGENVLADQLLTNGQASFQTDQLTIGGHMLTVIYEGTSSFAAGVSPILFQSRSPRPR
jgi:hypothetical protein